MTRYGRGRVTRNDEAAAVLTSLAIGTGVAVASWYMLRLFLGREPLSRTLAGTDAEGAAALPAGDTGSESGD